MTKEEKEFINAAQHGNLQKVKDLVKRGIDIHINAEYALCLTSRNGHLDVVKFLIDKVLIFIFLKMNLCVGRQTMVI